jgi:hypothetical protein
MDTKVAQAPIIGYVLTNAGLMANLSLDGTKFNKLDLLTRDGRPRGFARRARRGPCDPSPRVGGGGSRPRCRSCSSLLRGPRRRCARRPTARRTPLPRRDPSGASAAPEVCLVLSGGGARGAAHVGVLRVLERLRVPVDCITGTSMGSIVGGAYASGTPLDDMEKTVATMSTRLLFTEKPPRDGALGAPEAGRHTDPLPIEIGIRVKEVLLPKGLVSGVQLERCCAS